MSHLPETHLPHIKSVGGQDVAVNTQAVLYVLVGRAEPRALVSCAPDDPKLATKFATARISELARCNASGVDPDRVEFAIVNAPDGV